MGGTNHLPGEDTAIPRSVLVQPTRSELSRRAPEVWLHDAVLGEEFFAYMGLPAAYRDTPARVLEFGAVYYDTRTKICLDDQGEVIFWNTALGANAPRVAAWAEAIRDTIAAGRVTALTEPGPLALLASPRHDNYYHFLFDDLGRLGYYDAVAPACQARFPVPEPRPWQRQLYALAGIEARLLPLRPGVYALRDVWVAPRGLAKIVEIRSRAFDRILALADRLPDQPPQTPGAAGSRLFVSRESADHRRLRNEREVREIVTAAGFHVVQPETLPVAEQIRLFRDAEVVMGVFGAGLTNAAFMRPGRPLLELAPSRPTTPPFVHNAIFATIAGVRGLRYGLVSAPAQDVQPDTGDFSVPLDWVRALLAQML
jgi:hypothetical protein